MSGFELTVLGWLEVGAALALSGAAIVALYLVRRRPRVVVVPSLSLLAGLLPEARKVRQRARIEHLLSLLLALLIAALLAVAMGGPRLRRVASAPRTLIFVADRTASMQARDAQGRRRFDRVRQAMLARLEALRPSDEVILLGLTGHAEVLHPATTDHAALGAVLARLEPTDAPGEAAEVARWAPELCARPAALAALGPEGMSGAARPEAPCRVEIFTDGVVPDLDEAVASMRRRDLDVAVRSVGPAVPRGNVAITAFSARRVPSDPSRAEVLVEVASFDDVPREVSLALSADGLLAHRERLLLGARARVRRTFDDVTGADTLLEARLEPTAGDGSDSDAAALDDFALDDVAWAVLPPRRRRRALLVAPERRPSVYLEAALLLDPGLDVATVAPEEFSEPAMLERDLVVFDGWLPETAPPKPFLALGPGVPSRAWMPVGAPIAAPRFDTQLRNHPLLRFVALGDVNIASARPIVPMPGDVVVAGEARGALLVEGERGGARFIALAFDPRESDLPLRIAWPVLVLGAIGELVPDDVALLSSARTGRPHRLAVEATTATLVRRDPGAAPLSIDITARDGRGLIELERVGVYEVRTSSPGVAALVVANLFDARESSLVPAEVPGVEPIEDALAAPIDGEVSTPDQARWLAWLSNDLQALLVALALVLVAFEWLTFHRRWTT